MWTILERFGYKDVYEELSATRKENNLHRLANILTLVAEVHDDFDNLNLWFEEIEGNVRRFLSAR